MSKRNIGDRVKIVADRTQGGSIVPPRSSWTSLIGTGNYRVHDAVIAQVRICGTSAYGLEWADTRTPIGLPFFERDFYV